MKPWQFHLLLTCTIFVFYAYLWLDKFSYTGKPGWNGFNLFMMTAFAAPIIIIYHLVSIGYSLKQKDRYILTVNLVGLSLCGLHILAVCNSM